MEASVSQDGTQTTPAEATPPEGGQETQQFAQLPPEITQRLDEVAGLRDELQPLLQNMQQQQQPQEPEGSYGDYLDEQGMLLDPEGFQQYTAQEIQRGIEQGLQAQMGPLQQRLEAQEAWRTQEQFEDLKAQFPQIADPEYQQKLVPQVEAAAAQFAQAMGLGQEYAQMLAVNPHFVAREYLAGLAREQAQQPAAAGDQGVHLEGGTGNPGQPERDAKQEWLGGNQLGAQSTPFGRSLDQF